MLNLTLYFSESVYCSNVARLDTVIIECLQYGGVKLFCIWYLWYHRWKMLPSNARRSHFDRCRPMYYLKTVVFAVAVAWEGGNGHVVMT